MSTPRERRLLFLCAGLLLCTGAASSANPAQSKSWFDQQLLRKTQALASHIHNSSDRDALISVATLDEIYDLREHVSDPFAIDATLAGITNEAGATAITSAEASYLAARIKGSSLVESQDMEALIGRSRNDLSDSQMQNALIEIALLHHLPIAATRDQRAEPDSAEGWYLASKIATDDFHRVQALRRVLELNRDYVPAVTEMAKRYSAQGQITRARNLLSATLERYPAESSIRMLLAELEINQGHASAALEVMNQLRSKPSSISVTRQLAEELFKKVLKYSTAEETEAIIGSSAFSLTRFANNIIHQNVAEEGARSRSRQRTARSFQSAAGRLPTLRTSSSTS